MKTIAYSIIVYFLLAFIFKLFGDMNENAWVNYYWMFSSLFFGLIFLKVIFFFKISEIKNKHNKRDMSLYKFTITCMSAYWGIMLALRVYIAFNIHLYDKFISSANTFTIGGMTIILIFILIIITIIYTARK